MKKKKSSTKGTSLGRRDAQASISPSVNRPCCAASTRCCAVICHICSIRSERTRRLATAGIG
jgi:hypothetical protein